jgi:group II intron reverse transcriptase/maturase
VLAPHYEPTFHRSSHGLRPGRSCHTAIAEAKQYLKDGYEWVVDLDLEKFFDRVNHQRLMAHLGQKVFNQRLLKLIHQMLKANVVMPDGVVVSTAEGVPQGGPLSPLLSNIVLDELDRELEQRGHHFVRYADDCNIYVSSERAGQRVMASIVRFIERRLRLKVNADKSAVSRPEKRHFVGFRLRREPMDGSVEVLCTSEGDFEPLLCDIGGVAADGRVGARQNRAGALGGRSVTAAQWIKPSATHGLRRAGLSRWKGNGSTFQSRHVTAQAQLPLELG